jgi:hypothetical protein
MWRRRPRRPSCPGRFSRCALINFAVEFRNCPCSQPFSVGEHRKQALSLGCQSHASATLFQNWHPDTQPELSDTPIRSAICLFARPSNTPESTCCSFGEQFGFPPARECWLAPDCALSHTVWVAAKLVKIERRGLGTRTHGPERRRSGETRAVAVAEPVHGGIAGSNSSKSEGRRFPQADPSRRDRNRHRSNTSSQ